MLDLMHFLDIFFKVFKFLYNFCQCNNVWFIVASKSKLWYLDMAKYMRDIID